MREEEDERMLQGQFKVRSAIQGVPRDIYVLNDGLVEVRPPRFLGFLPILRFIGRPLMRYFGREALREKATRIELLGTHAACADLAACVRGSKSFPVDSVKAMRLSRSSFMVETTDGKQHEWDLDDDEDDDYASASRFIAAAFGSRFNSETGAGF
jgi:hypothetical protein